MIKHRVLVRFISVATLFAAGVANGQLFLVDFEGLPEDTEISDQFEGIGVTFSIDGDPGLLPIVAVEGSPLRAFGGSGDDRPMSSGAGGLTDPLIGGDFTVGNDIVMSFDPPVEAVRFFVIDIDGAEVFTARAFDGLAEVATLTRSVGDPGTGNAISTEFTFAAASITSIVVDVPASTGFAIDFLTFLRPCEGPGCGSAIRVAQETRPGAGDFGDNVLGVIRPFPTGTDAVGFYAYNVPQGDSWNGAALTPEADRSHLLLARNLEGLSLFIVHDRAFPDDPDGGRAEMNIELIGDADGAVRSVEDDPDSTDVYTGDDGDSVFTAVNNWSPCCTDGFALTGIDCRASVLLQFTEVDGLATAPIGGMTEWTIYSANGDEIPLAIEVDRRVRLDVLPDPKCPADLNCNDIVEFGDLLLLLSAWGPCDGCAEDLDESGAVEFSDLLMMLSTWGACF